MLIVFAAGVVRLFELRFDVGDVYPPYSTLRSDPLGAKAFFESLSALPGLRVERSLRPLSALGTEPLRPADYDNGERTFTCFDLGEDALEWPFLLEPAAVERLEAIMARGGRVVLSFQPTTVPPSLERLSSLRVSRLERRDAPDHRGPTAERLAEKQRPPDLIARWGIDFVRATGRASAGRAAEPTGVATPAAGLAARRGPDAAFALGQEAVPWRSVVDFRTGTVRAVASRWRALYQRRGRPVIVARPFGTAGGELVLVGDSYFLSNEGLRDAASPAVLAALVGDGRRVIFDESHLDIREQPGLMTLARRYRLQGALASLALLVALFVWRNVVSLVPLRREQDGSTSAEADTVAGHSVEAGYLNLLRRSVRPRELPAVCLAQWEMGGGAAAERVRAVVAHEAAQPARRRSPVALVYR
ncbi:MAG: hypothetical protein INR64_11415, partial [Caulobacteraceae bacterium]|nr:hypothetical protein [Caulobacter sp.]